MSTIYYISNKTISSLHLWRSDPTKFRITKFDHFQPLLSGTDYILIHKDYITVLNRIDKNQLDIQPVVICRASTGEEWNQYYELKIKNEVTSENINSLNVDGDNIWQFDNNLFVSEKIKDELIKMSNGKLIGTPNFSLFG